MSHQYSLQNCGSRPLQSTIKIQGRPKRSGKRLFASRLAVQANMGEQMAHHTVIGIGEALFGTSSSNVFTLNIWLKIQDALMFVFTACINFIVQTAWQTSSENPKKR